MCRRLEMGTVPPCHRSCSIPVPTPAAGMAVGAGKVAQERRCHREGPVCERCGAWAGSWTGTRDEDAMGCVGLDSTPLQRLGAGVCAGINRGMEGPESLA